MENTIINERYRLLASLGSGGEAHVYRACDMLTEDVVAVRLTLQSCTYSGPEHLPDFHDGWIRFITMGVDPLFGAYQVFELLEGQPLRQLVQSCPLNADDWLLFVDQSLNAVEALHAVDWPHGDLNADNFFQTASGWKLLELPFLRFDPPAGRSALFGSIHTLAPEQFNGHRPDVRTDLYSLGCLYYYAASGTYPHPGANSQEVAIHCLRFAPVPLQQASPGLPPAWAEWVMKLLATKAEERCPSVAAARQLLGVA